MRNDRRMGKMSMELRGASELSSANTRSRTANDSSLRQSDMDDSSSL